MSFSEQSLSARLASLLPAGAGLARDEVPQSCRGQGPLPQQIACSAPKLVVALSGGLDSCVLLHATQRIRREFPGWALSAVHVHHGLSPNADHWQAFCEKTCSELGVPLFVVRVQIERDGSASLEGLAREKRYEAFADLLEPGDCLLMAHHLDDQAETFLLRTLRGAGPRGLAAMPVTRPLGKGTLIRPLLSFSRQDLETWAAEQDIANIEDESNTSTQFDRNYSRHEVLPRIAERWPGYRESWLRSAQLCAEADALLEELAELDLASVSTDEASVIRYAGLLTLHEARQRNLLRYWLRKAGAGDPGWQLLSRMVDEVIGAADDAQPQLTWQSALGEVVLRRHGGMLHLLRQCQTLNLAAIQIWTPPATMMLENNGCVHAVPCSRGLRMAHGQQFTLRYRQGGEECRLAGRPNRPLKKILQEVGMAPWLRARLPLVYADDELAYVPGVGVCEGWQAGADDPAWEVVWSSPF